MKKYLYKVGIYFLRFYWFLFRPNGYGVKCIVENREGKILFIKNTYGRGNWNLPGGRIEKKESSVVAVKREVFEEVGIKLDSITKLGSFVSTLEYKKDYIDVFGGKAVGEIKIQKSEISEYIWTDKKLPPNPLSQIAKMALELR